MIFEEGEILRLKKPHACGGDGFEVVRSGADVKIKCLKCGHVITVDIDKLKKSVKAGKVKK